MKSARTCVAVAYLRVSTDKQADSGLGLEAQRSSVTAAAQRLVLSLASEFVDAGVSSALTLNARPVLMQAISALKRGDVLLVAKRDRLSRDVIETAMIERLVTKRGARILSAAGEGTESDDPSGMLMRRLIDSFAEYERLIISARTKHALSAKRRRGERTSRFARYGYQLDSDNRRLEINADEQRVVETIDVLHHSGRSLRAIAAELNENGLRTRSGAPWRFEYVRNILGASRDRRDARRDAVHDDSVIASASAVGLHPNPSITAESVRCTHLRSDQLFGEG
jgi:DNA invertase Pin-like site-specific DNA recombinase